MTYLLLFRFVSARKNAFVGLDLCFFKGIDISNKRTNKHEKPRDISTRIRVSFIALLFALHISVYAGS